MAKAAKEVKDEPLEKIVIGAKSLYGVMGVGNMVHPLPAVPIFHGCGIL
jgi:hypothetical protein